jgi:hypothetical protein
LFVEADFSSGRIMLLNQRPRVVEQHLLRHPAKMAKRCLNAVHPRRLPLMAKRLRVEPPRVSQRCGIPTIRHGRNRGCGRNQKTCYAAALARGANIIMMLHPDYQYTRKPVTAMASMIASGEFDMVLDSRILSRGALAGGMPLYKYVSNRFMTFFENIMIGQKLSEHHTGYRAWSRAVLERLPLLHNSDDFVFDNQARAIGLFWVPDRRGNLPTKYFPEASSINF